MHRSEGAIKKYRVPIIISGLLCLLLSIPNLAEALTIKKARMSGNSLELEIRNAVQGPLTDNGSAVGNINNKGEFKDTINPFSSATSVIAVSDGSGL